MVPKLVLDELIINVLLVKQDLDSLIINVSKHVLIIIIWVQTEYVKLVAGRVSTLILKRNIAVCANQAGLI